MNQLKKILQTLLFTFSTWTGFAQQNLVPNHSFEDADSCNNYLKFYLVHSWFSPTEGTPDIFSECLDVEMSYSVPINRIGYQPAQDGKAYMGIVVYSDGYEYREFIGVELKETLKTNQLYKIEYYVNLANFSPFYTNNVGIGFGLDSCKVPYNYQIRPIVSITDKRMVSDTVNWEKRTIFYNARGDERFLYFGNFKLDAETRAIRHSSSNDEQFVLIDNVSVALFDLNVENVFTPNGDNINDRAFYYPGITDVRCDVFNRWGERIRQVDISKGWDGKDEQGNKLPEGTYFYQLIGEVQQLIIASGFIQLIE